MKYGFIGCGNMGGALARALSKTTKDIMLSDHDPKKAEDLAFDLGCEYGTNNEVFQKCERVFLGVKPQVMETMLSESSKVLSEAKPLLITMAAGLSMSRIAQFAGYGARVIRIMPNTPVLVEMGMILYTKNDLVSEVEIKSFVSDMTWAGEFDQIDEALMDAGCSLSGCGPAFVYMMIDGLAKGAVECGLSEDKAIKYAAQTMLGAAQMVLSTGEEPDSLKIKVCSPGGSTIEGVRTLENADFYRICSDAVKASFKRNVELGK